MPLFQLIVLAAVQGITEFLPISSSAHLILVPVLTGWRDQGLVIDVAVHVGTLLAVLLYFWRDIMDIVQGVARSFGGQRDRRRQTNGLALFFRLIVATIPVLAAGYALNEFVSGGIRSVEIIAWATVGFAILLYLADRSSMTVRKLEHLSYGGALFIGCAQMLALIPGASRAGVTMTAARLLGMERPDVARFSMLLSIPVIIAAGALKGIELYQSGDAQLTSDALMAAGLSAVFALITIALFMAWLRRASFAPFVIYRILLGGGLLYLVYFGADLKIF